uniref:Uncharacterized protein n=1 Tax=Haptolina brevifila TaxID=156173 RepID=A0A7S2HWU9_9EUKA|mmetsp:Transcript_58583/g.116331  ORF Transcript_58583/g.116331 Transcript_58583/m.116331 type:complete len:176 (+) Transcript_58583:354-881(+)
MSDEGRIAAVDDRFYSDDRMRNTKETTGPSLCGLTSGPDRRWIARVDRGELPEDDQRECKSLSAKFAKDQGLFRQHCGLLERTAASGSPRENIEHTDLNSQFRNCTTDRFYYYDQHDAPMSRPPFTVNGGSAGDGGKARSNYFDKLQRRFGTTHESDDGQQRCGPERQLRLGAAG